jgi:hypothetical protein
MAILRERKEETMGRPQPEHAIVIEPHEHDARHLLVWTATDEARAWLKQEAPIYARWFEANSLGGAHVLRVSPCYSTQAVIDWLRSMGQGTPPQEQEAA